MGNVFVRVEASVALPGEQPKWFVLVNGVQQGGCYDISGAGDREFESEEEAREWAARVLYDISFTWEG